VAGTARFWRFSPVLEERGHTCSVWLCDPYWNDHSSAAVLRRMIVEDFVPLRAPAPVVEPTVGADVAPCDWLGHPPTRPPWLYYHGARERDTSGRRAARRRLSSDTAFRSRPRAGPTCRRSQAAQRHAHSADLGASLAHAHVPGLNVFATNTEAPARRYDPEPSMKALANAPGRLSLARHIGAVLRPLGLHKPLGRAYDKLPALPELARPREYSRAAALWQELRNDGYTMLSSRRARTLQRLARTSSKERVVGDLVDCGTFNGGSTVMLSTGAPDREVWAFDSFEGLPEAGPRDPARAQEWTGALGASDAKVHEAFKQFASPARLHIVKGWFHETFPQAAPEIERVAVLHADGDWYESVRLTLETFEPKVSVGGFVVIDDYGAWEGAKEATDEYRAARNISAPLMGIDATGVYWRKTAV
jgi:O-methyltransferase